ncbi:MAG: hypothetical protein QM750_20170 [Rubrivivax sp.]
MGGDVSGEAPNPYWEQAKHIIGATLLFVLIAVVAIGIDQSTRWLISLKLLETNSAIHWALTIAEYFLFLLDIVALLAIAAITTYKYVKGFFK